MIHRFLSIRPVLTLNESAKTIRMTKDAIDRYAAMKVNGRPQYQLMSPGSTRVVSKGEAVDYYDDNGDKCYGVVQSVNAKTGEVKIKCSKTKQVVTIQGYPKGVIG